MAYRYGRRDRVHPGVLAVGAAVVLAALTGAGHASGHHHHHGPAAASDATATAIAYARAQLGKPYVWGGTGPAGYDCSGLVMEAYASAGVPIPRTSQDQWASLPHVSSPRPGDLVFFPGGDGTWSAPGHVALVISATKMIEAYATGYPVRVSPLNGNGAGGIVGYARPS
jgi:cell wall-associated NlpC family hydrolase